MALACAKTPAPAEPSPTPSGAPVPSAVASAAPAPGPSAARWLGDGCHAGVGAGGPAAERAERVAEACAPGSQPLGEAKTLPGPGEVKLELPDGGVCLRVVAVSESAAADVTLELVDERGLIRAADALPGSVALVGPRGPVCFGSGGSAVARVGFARGGGSLRLSAHRL